MKKLILAILMLLLAPATVLAADYSIVAVVGDEVITNYALQQRTDLITRSSNIRETPEARRQIIPKVLQIMIDDKLKMIEAKRLKIEVTEEDMKRAIADLEKQNRLPPGGFDEFLRRNNFPKESLMDQVRTQIAWRKIIGQRIRPRISLSEAELDENYNIALNRKPVPKPQEKPKLDIQNSKVSLRQVIVDAPKENAEARNLGQAKIKNISNLISNCSDVTRMEKENTDNAVHYADLGTLKISSIETKLQPLIARLSAGKPSAVLTSDKGFAIFVACSRSDVMTKVPEPAPEQPLDKNKVAEMLGNQKIDLEARRYLKNLRDDTYIEIRL